MSFLSDQKTFRQQIALCVLAIGVLLHYAHLSMAQRNKSAEEVRQPKVGIFYKFYRKVFPTEEQKAIREALKKGIKPRLNQEGVALLETPAALKTVIGEFHLDCRGSAAVSYSCDCSQIESPEKAYIELKGAYELLLQHPLSKKDIMLMLEIGDFLANETGEDKYKGRRGYKVWLFEQCQRLETCFGDEISKTQGEIDLLQAKRDSVVVQIEELISKLKDLETQIDRLDEKIKTLGKEKQVAEMQLTASLQNYQKVIRQLENLVPSNDPVWSSEPIAGTNDGIRLVRSNTETDPTFSPNLTSYRLGDHCSGEIQRAAEAITEAVLNQQYAALRNPDAANDIRITLKIRGKADGTPLRNCLIYYGEPIQETYYRVLYGYVEKKEAIRVELANGECKIDNEMLAFLRAYCAYQQILDVLEAKKLSQFFVEEGRNRGVVEFQTEVFEEKGKEFRGVDIQIGINGLYQHKQREKQALEQRRERLRAEQTASTEKMQKLEREKAIIDAKIEKLEQLRRYYEEKLLSPEVIQRDIDKIIENIEMYETLTPATKKLVKEGTVSIGQVYKYINLPEEDKKAIRKGEKTLADF